MNDYTHILDTMMQAIISGDTSYARLLFRGKKKFMPENQLSVYIQGYHRRLFKVISRIYDGTRYYLGEKIFRERVKYFITAMPSQCYNIEQYALKFSDYTGSICQDKYEYELALLESTLCELSYLPETAALTHGWLEQHTADTLAAASLQLRAASCLLVFSYSVSEFIIKLRSGEQPEKPEIARNYLMVLREGYQTYPVSLEEGEFVLLSLIAEGHTLGQAFTSPRFLPYIAAENLAYDFQRWFARWISEGMLTCVPIKEYQLL